MEILNKTPNCPSRDIDVLLHDLCHKLSHTHKRTLFLKQNILEKEHVRIEKLDEKKISRLQKQQDMNHINSGASTVDKAVQTAGSVFSTLTLFASGAHPFGILACAVNGLLALDGLCDHVIKKQVAGVLQTMNGEAKTTWLDRLHQITSVASFGLGMVTSGPTYITCAVHASKTAISAIKGGVDYSMGLHQSKLIRLETKHVHVQRRRTQIIDHIEETVSRFQDLYMSIHRELELREKKIRYMIHSDPVSQ